MTTLFRLLSCVPLPVMHRIGTWLGWVVWCCSPSYRRQFMANAEGAGFTPAQYRPAIGAAGAMVAELPWVWLRPRSESVLPRVIRWEGIERYEAALAARKGVITMTPHLGSFEMLGQALGERFLAQYGPLTALFRPPRKVWLRPLVAGSRDREGLKMLPTTLAGVRGLIRVLRAGGYTGVLPDQVPPAGQGVWAPFFGRPAYTMTLMTRLAQQTGAQLFLGVCERLPRGAGYVIRLEPFDSSVLTEPGASAEATAGAVNEAVARLIGTLPGQYLWGYARYKQPRSEAAEGTQP